ncbi:MAG: zf-HC2 domain-containing protein [Candidatus Acidiferrales bacterium]
MKNLSMNEHNKIRETLALAAADALDPRESEQVMQHARTCPECSAELEQWQLLTRGLRQLPTPQPSADLVQRTCTRAEAWLVDEREHVWNRRVMVSLVAFAWALTLSSWPLVRLVSGGFLSLLDPRLNQSWLGFAGFTSVVWLTGGIAAILLSVHQRRERRLA